jgi:hypothetical protein
MSAASQSAHASRTCGNQRTPMDAYVSAEGEQFGWMEIEQALADLRTWGRSRGTMAGV